MEERVALAGSNGAIDADCLALTDQDLSPTRMREASTSALATARGLPSSPAGTCARAGMRGASDPTRCSTELEPDASDVAALLGAIESGAAVS